MPVQSVFPKCSFYVCVDETEVKEGWDTERSPQSKVKCRHTTEGGWVKTDVGGSLHLDWLDTETLRMLVPGSYLKVTVEIGYPDGRGPDNKFDAICHQLGGSAVVIGGVPVTVHKSDDKPEEQS